MMLPRPIQDLIDSFEKLPGIGPKTAARLSFYLLNVPSTEIANFASALLGLKEKISLCRLCKNVTEKNPCPICLDQSRDVKTICVVENILDVVSMEKTGKFRGIYHVLHGAINPLQNIGPDELFMRELIQRIKEAKNGRAVKEIILATNPTMEGEATALYLARAIRNEDGGIVISRLAVGMPIGGDMVYADEITLTRALEGRTVLL